jgi:phosphopantothenoylcysteine decarboxylase/phosphopantothenate--cysteine ligase
MGRKLGWRRKHDFLCSHSRTLQWLVTGRIVGLCHRQAQSWACLNRIKNTRFPGFSLGSPERAGSLPACLPPSALQTGPVKVLVTAGPTREPIDPVRFLSNRSSGKMGYELAHAFAAAGHQVLLISGPTALDVPDGVDFIPVETAEEMHEAVRHHIGRMQIAVFAAAVADYTPARIAPEKLKKSGETLTLELVRTPDILGSTRSDFGFTGTLVGFAAETENLLVNARDKLVRKHCDLIIANDVSKPGIGFDSDHNEVTLVYPERTESLPIATKHDLAHQLVQAILEIHAKRIVDCR